MVAEDDSVDLDMEGAVSLMRKRIPALNDRLELYLQKEMNGIPRDVLDEDYHYVNDRVIAIIGLMMAIDNIDAVVDIVLNSDERAKAKALLIDMGFSGRQAGEVLRMKLKKLTQLDRSDLESELDRFTKIADCLQDYELFHSENAYV